VLICDSRICAGTVCGSCSERKINDQRVCDICFFKANTQQKEKIREDTLNEKIRIIRQKKEELFHEQRKFEQKKAEYKNLKMEVSLGLITIQLKTFSIARRKMKKK